MNYEFSISAVFYFLILIMGLLIGIILIFKHFLKRSSKSIFQYRSSFLLLGFIVSIAFLFVVINLTIAQKRYLPVPDDMVTDIIDIDIPIMVPPVKKPIPKPPPPMIETVPDEELQDNQPEFLSSDIDIDDVVDDSEFDLPENASPPPLPKMEDNEPPLPVVGIMPRFPGCEELNTNAEREKCARNKFLNYIYSNLTYPVLARESGIEGRVVVRFIVEKDGSISGSEILRDIGAGCGQEVIKVLNDMNAKNLKWVPGKQGGRKVRVYFTLPVEFKLRG